MHAEANMLVETKGIDGIPKDGSICIQLVTYM